MPAVGFNWYINHGGVKKWLKWFTFSPMFFVFIIALVFILESFLSAHRNSDSGLGAVMYIPSILERILSIIAVIAFLLLALNVTIGPIIFVRWYAKHGGSKRWLVKLSYLLVFIIIISFSYFLVRANLF